LPEPLIQLDTSQEKLERLIWEIAWTAHQETAGREEVADIPRLEVVEIAEKHLGNLAKAEAFLEYTEQRAHLLLGRGGVAGRVYAFPHRTFQEYLAACWLTTFRRFPQEAARLAEEPALWREVLLLAAGTLVFNQNNREKALDGVAGVLPDRKPNPGDEAGWSRVWLAGEMMAVVGRETAEADEVGRELLPRLREQLAALLSGGRLPPRQRAEAGDALGQLGDPRPGVCDREPEVIYLSAGTFLMGLRNHEIYLPTFAIARYPVTNAQFRTFVEDGGYTAKWRHCWTKEGWQFWDSERWSEPRYWQDAFWSLDNKPVVGVSWYEAAAYANWLSQVMGRDFRLPTEAQWERAARHTDGRIYPWGDEWQDGLVNSEESGLNRTTAVGSFPGGAAVCGAHDLSGNVWEWCSTRYRDENGQEYPTPYRPDDGREDLSGDVSIWRVLRGGAFNTFQWDMRAAVRSGSDPFSGYNYIGFRVVEHLS
jgi:formylglycine-generating enzyme required for sulfatase activity